METRYAFCPLPNIPLRKEPTDGAEMMTELLFGDACEVTEEYGTWSRIKNKADGYTGWLTTKMLAWTDKATFDSYDPLAQPVVTAFTAMTFNTRTGEHMMLTGGSILPMYDKFSSTFQAGKERFHIDKQLIEPVIGKESLAETAARFINSPYLWGGKNAMGIDCSGLTQVVLRMHGVQINRDARAQIVHGTAVDGIEQAAEGDLMFFNNAEGRIVHVGIYAGNGRIIHASGSVHTDIIDSKGIYSESLGRYTHTLHSIRRIAVGG